MAGDPLESAKLKVDRANHDADALKKAIEGWMDDRPYTLTIKTDAKTGEDACVIHIEKPPPHKWGIAIGEVVYALRSALDHAVYGICALSGEPPHGTEFPVFKDESQFRRSERPGGLWKARGLPSGPLAVVESIQPFHHGQDPEHHPLWVLQELCNADKHRLLNTTSAVFGMSNFRLSPEGDIRVTSSEVRANGPVEDGTELARWSVIAGTHGKVTVEGDVAYDVAFEKAGPGKGHAVRNGLDMLGTTVKSILRMLEDAL